MSSRRLLPDPFTLALLATVVLASLLPCRGELAQTFDVITDAAIALLFFLHGAKLPRSAIMQGLAHWRLHLTVFAGTFVLFPLLGLALRPLGHALLTPDLYLGLLFVCALPSTVQSSIAFTSIAGGNVPAAVVSASMSNLIGIALTPLLVGLLLATRGGGASWHGVLDIVLQLLLPFALGHGARRWIGGWIDRHKPVLGYTDRGTILLVVYTAFSAAVVAGLWRDTPLSALLSTLAMCGLLLALMMPVLTWAARRLGFSREDEITIVFCGSKKSMASGIPMAKILFAGQLGGLGALVLPLMIFHQLQLMVCAVVARRYAARGVRRVGEDDREAD
ncbi:bile acid:sodium symporter [Rhodanobacter sp. FDAARGOS 1247]|uniref:bile acid:sodium symporter family protein n=1 Tax=Rhodanobacter sp. FDAARGOS 1247 TaxID=2778082 RepID=UPI00194F96A0|nr:bile acid:sodium symporter family protein [Rhodanobacter sp. FDAARGOS 1247]QRP63653.1 bile acid:sodium symporter [Rhodanobacter sp. FDAARGOS 1247]